MSTHIYNHLKEVCQSLDLKATNQRYIIYKTILENKKHPTADDLFKQVAPLLPSLSRDTVYRAMNLLVKGGLVKKVLVPGGAIHFDGDLSPHHHFICQSCGAILDIKWPELDALPWPKTAFIVGTPCQLTTTVFGLGVCCK